MIQKITVALLTLLFSNIGFSQNASDSLLQLGNKYYRNKEFDKAGKTWYQSAMLADYKISKQTNFYYAAIAFAEAKDSVNTFHCLDMAITKNGFNDLPALKTDETFAFINQSGRWLKLINSIKPVYTTDPLKVQVIDTDVKNFWAAYDKIKTSKNKPEQLYKQLYFDKGTMALQFYLVNKIQTIDNFVYMHTAKHKYYESIRANTLKAAQLKPAYQKSFIKLKQIYPEAIFPPIYFVVGKLRSAGTSCSYGLILGVDQACMAATADTSELTTWEKHNISSFNGLPYTVAHELIHYLQDGMASDTTLLRASLVEGMADFIGELISGKTANERLKLFAKGKEKQIWESFEKEMYLDKAENWIANADQETADKPADLGYWMGYQICKSYYENATEKQKAIYDMLHIQDYKKFFDDSKFKLKASSW
jgi:hypothetical protein